MATATISQSGTLRAAVGTDLIEVESAGGVSAHVQASSIASSSSPIQSATVTLTAADLAALDSTPFELVAAPGAGKINVPDQFPAVGALNGGIFPALTGELIAAYYGNTGIAASENSSASFGGAFSGSGKYGIAPANDLYVGASWEDATDVENQPLILDANSALPIPGAIATSSLNDGGADYADGDTFTVDTGLGTLATGHVVSQTAGVVTAYVLDTTPNGYLVATGVATTATTGIGTGLLIDIDTLDYSANPMTLTVKTLYSVMDV